MSIDGKVANDVRHYSGRSFYSIDNGRNFSRKSSTLSTMNKKKSITKIQERKSLESDDVSVVMDVVKEEVKRTFIRVERNQQNRQQLRYLTKQTEEKCLKGIMTSSPNIKHHLFKNSITKNFIPDEAKMKSLTKHSNLISNDCKSVDTKKKKLRKRNKRKNKKMKIIDDCQNRIEKRQEMILNLDKPMSMDQTSDSLPMITPMEENLNETKTISPEENKFQEQTFYLTPTISDKNITNQTKLNSENKSNIQNDDEITTSLVFSIPNEWIENLKCYLEDLEKMERSESCPKSLEPSELTVYYTPTNITNLNRSSISNDSESSSNQNMDDDVDKTPPPLKSYHSSAFLPTKTSESALEQFESIMTPATITIDDPSKYLSPNKPKTTIGPNLNNSTSQQLSSSIISDDEPHETSLFLRVSISDSELILGSLSEELRKSSIKSQAIQPTKKSKDSEMMVKSQPIPQPILKSQDNETSIKNQSIPQSTPKSKDNEIMVKSQPKMDKDKETQDNKKSIEMKSNNDPTLIRLSSIDNKLSEEKSKFLASPFLSNGNEQIQEEKPKSIEVDETLEQKIKFDELTLIKLSPKIEYKPLNEEIISGPMKKNNEERITIKIEEQAPFSIDQAESAVSKIISSEIRSELKFLSTPKFSSTPPSSIKSCNWRLTLKDQILKSTRSLETNNVPTSPHYLPEELELLKDKLKSKLSSQTISMKIDKSPYDKKSLRTQKTLLTMEKKYSSPLMFLKNQANQQTMDNLLSWRKDSKSPGKQSQYDLLPEIDKEEKSEVLWSLTTSTSLNTSPREKSELMTKSMKDFSKLINESIKTKTSDSISLTFVPTKSMQTSSNFKVASIKKSSNIKIETNSPSLEHNKYILLKTQSARKMSDVMFQRNNLKSQNNNHIYCKFVMEKENQKIKPMIKSIQLYAKSVPNKQTIKQNMKSIKKQVEETEYKKSISSSDMIQNVIKSERNLSKFWLKSFKKPPIIYNEHIKENIYKNLIDFFIYENEFTNYSEELVNMDIWYEPNQQIDDQLKKFDDQKQLFENIEHLKQRQQKHLSNLYEMRLRLLKQSKMMQKPKRFTSFNLKLGIILVSTIMGLIVIKYLLVPVLMKI